MVEALFIVGIVVGALYIIGNGVYLFLFFANQSQTDVPGSPVISDKDEVKVKATLIERRHFYDTRWLVDVTTPEESFSCEITRQEDESSEALEAAVREAIKMNTRKELVLALDERHKIFYD